MRNLVSRRQRVVRARHVQHSMAVAETARARAEMDSIAHNAERLVRARKELFRTENLATGASLAAYRELASRLEQAGRQLDGALYDARRRVGEKEGRQREANREHEIAQRLKDRAREALEEQEEARLAALPRRRLQIRKEG